MERCDLFPPSTPPQPPTPTPQAAKLVSQLPADDAGRVKAASIARALGVTDGPGFDALVGALTEGGGAGERPAAHARARPLPPRPAAPLRMPVLLALLPRRAEPRRTRIYYIPCGVSR